MQQGIASHPHAGPPTWNVMVELTISERPTFPETDWLKEGPVPVNATCNGAVLSVILEQEALPAQVWEQSV
jgi:hypothetical protein